jgi:L-threonylcarbamoyladenylate synthase
LSLDDVVAALQSGAVVGIPTDTVYGLVTLREFAERLYEVKGRPASLDLPVLVADFEQAQTLATFTPEAQRLAACFWPGKLTIVVDGVGLRIPAHNVPRYLARIVGPLASTSANLHGEPPLATAAGVAKLKGVKIVVDGGHCEGAPSTVVSVDPLRVLREGAIASADVERAAAGN